MMEDEAKTKWCPFTRVTPVSRPTAHIWAITNREDPIGDEDTDLRSSCLASACMAWRWDDPYTGMAEEGHGGDLTYRLSRKAGQPRQGYCGLAGTPILRGA